MLFLDWIVLLFQIAKIKNVHKCCKQGDFLLHTKENELQRINHKMLIFVIHLREIRLFYKLFHFLLALKMW